MNLDDVEGLDQITSVTPPTNLDTSYTIGEIMHQQSTTAFDTGSGGVNNSISGSQNMSHAAEQSSRHLIIAALPKTTATYVLLVLSNVGRYEMNLSISHNSFTMNSYIMK